MYQIKLDQFEGPLDLLLQLIEKEELDITQISLAKVADTYLEHLEQIEEVRPDELADFLVVAARLLLIKSTLLLPGAISPEEEITDLVDQLKIYRQYLLASKTIHKMMGKKHFSYSREKFPAGLIQRHFRLTTKVTPTMLKNSLENIFNVIISQVKLAQKRIRKIISLKEKIAELIKLLKKCKEINLNNLISRATKEEVVVTFLAVLTLVREKTAEVHQDRLFGEIIIKNEEV